jgi:hypothetical protein
MLFAIEIRSSKTAETATYNNKVIFMIAGVHGLPLFPEPQLVRDLERTIVAAPQTLPRRRIVIGGQGVGAKRTLSQGFKW